MTPARSGRAERARELHEAGVPLRELAAQLPVPVLAAERYLLRAGVQVFVVSNSLRLRRFNALASARTDRGAGRGTAVGSPQSAAPDQTRGSAG